LVVGVMDRQGAAGVPFDVEGSGYGFKVMRQIKPEQASHAQQLQAWCGQVEWWLTLKAATVFSFRV
jgi:hypothetical protein